MFAFGARLLYFTIRPVSYTPSSHVWCHLPPSRHVLVVKRIRFRCLVGQYFWRVIDSAGMAMGFGSLFAKTKLPALLMVAVGHVCAAIGWVLGRKLRVNPFTASKTASKYSLHAERYRNMSGLCWSKLWSCLLQALSRWLVYTGNSARAQATEIRGICCCRLV